MAKRPKKVTPQELQANFDFLIEMNKAIREVQDILQTTKVKNNRHIEEFKSL